MWSSAGPFPYDAPARWRRSSFPIGARTARAPPADSPTEVVSARTGSIRATAGARRLDDPVDWVRLEIERALEAGVGIVPVRVAGAALELSDPRGRDDVDRLTQSLEQRFAIESTLPASAGGSASAAGYATRLVADLLDLATRPTQLIARRQTRLRRVAFRGPMVGLVLLAGAIWLAHAGLGRRGAGRLSRRVRRRSRALLAGLLWLVLLGGWVALVAWLG